MSPWSGLTSQLQWTKVAISIDNTLSVPFGFSSCHTAWARSCLVFFFSRFLCSYLIACQLRCSSPLLMISFCQLLLLSNSSVTMLNLFPFVLTSEVIVVQIVCSFHLVSFQSLLLEEINIIWIFLMESVRVVMTSTCCWSLGVHKHKVQRPSVVSWTLQCLPHSPVNN